ncbi:MAG: ABC transporter ATP-binding protein [Candidatus Lokiarchaeota archaeon]|nr:ABC transporter ATP-binding protein [Candidatus Lokiarchaeota archaeon]
MSSILLDDVEDYYIWTNNLTKVYRTGTKKTKAVNGINFKMSPGVHGFLGPNGAGKTSTINMLIGAISITQGDAYIKGKKAGTKKARKSIGFLPQDPAFYDKLSGLEYLIFQARLNSTPKSIAKQKALNLINFFDLMDAKDRKIKTYSMGMKQKIGLASGLIHDPKLLILDEPTSNLDPLVRKKIIDYVRKISKDMSIFISSHVLSEVEQMCDTVTIINKGKIILTDTVQNVKNWFSNSTNLYVVDTNSNETFLDVLKGLKMITNAWIDEKEKKIFVNINDIEQFQKIIPKLVIDNGLTLKSFYQPESSLQDVFLEIINEEEGKLNEA